MPNWNDDNGISWFGHDARMDQVCSNPRCAACSRYSGGADRRHVREAREEHRNDKRDDEQYEPMSWFDHDQRPLLTGERGAMTVQATKPPNQPTQPARMTLAAVTRGRVERPLRTLLYSTEGLGKSTFGSNAPSPIFLASEDGTSQLDVARFPEPKTWADALEVLNVLTIEDHSYKTLVIDTLDWLEPMVWEDVCSRPDDKGRRHKSITGFGYGKGYDAALDVWRTLVARMERLRAVKGMGIVLLAHTQIKSFKNPQGEDFDRYELKLHKHASGLLKEWADVVLFGAYETFVNEAGNRPKGVSTGARVIHTRRTAAFDAKNRHDLPEVMPLDWHTFAEAIAAHKPADPAKLRERINGLLAETNDVTLTERVTAAVMKCGDDSATLARIADKLAAEVGIKKQGEV